MSRKKDYSKRNVEKNTKKKSKKKKIKKTQRRKRLRKKNFQIGGSINPIMGDLLYILQKDVIEYLPTSKIMDLKLKHYLQMIDYITLQRLAEDDIKYKDSLSIQELFNHNSFKVDSNSNIFFDYSTIECDNILDNTHRSYYLRIIFFYLLECNLFKDKYNQSGGEGTEPMPVPTEPRPVPTEPKPEPKPEPALKSDKKIDDIPDDIPDNIQQKNRSEQELMDLVEIGNKMDQINILNQEELPGLDEYIKMKEELEIIDTIQSKDKKISVTNSNFVKYNTDWFNTCIGIDTFDPIFESKVKDEILKLGIRINNEELMNKMNILLEDENMRHSLKEAIYTRLSTCSKKPQGLLDKLLNRISFNSSINCDLKKPGSILYLYDEYKPLINNNTTDLNNVDIIIILIFCEIRQRLLSYHIALEVLRRNKNKTTIVQGLLEKLYKLDKKSLKKEEQDIKNRELEKNQFMKERSEKQQKLINEQAGYIDDNDILQDIITNNVELSDDQISMLKKQFKENNIRNQLFINEVNKDLEINDKEGDDLNVENQDIGKKENNMSGGTDLFSYVNRDTDNKDEELYKLDSSNISKKCKSIKQNIRLDDLNNINKCKVSLN